MENVKYLLVDANYYLFRNRFALGGGKRFNEGELLGSFILTLNKIRKEVNPGKIILSWDKTPYWKLEGLSDYKADRVTSSDIINDLNLKLQDKTLSKEEIDNIKFQLEQAKIDQDNFETTQHVKYSLIKYGDQFGLPSLIKQGVESDDFGYFISKYISESDIGYGAVASSDDDWRWNITDKCYWFNSRKSEFRLIDKTEQIEELIPLARDLNIPLFEYGQLYSVYYGNHNNVAPLPDNFINEVSFENFIKLYSEDKLKDTIAWKTFDSLNINKYYDICKPLIENVIHNTPAINMSSYWGFHRKYNINVYPNVVKSLINNLDESLYGNKEDLWDGIIENL